MRIHHLARCIISTLILFVFSSPVFAEEMKNDGWSSGQPLGFQAGFVAGEIGAVRLVPVTPGAHSLQNIQLTFGDLAVSESITLHVWDDSAGTNNPGTELFSNAYQLFGSSDSLNEIDLSSEGIVITGAIRVGIEFTHNSLPSIARDADGSIDATKNFIFTGGTWFQSNLLGLTGDWVIRANTSTGGGGPFTVGGSVSGLTGSMTLQNNGGDDLVINTNGPFVFATPLADGAAYNVTVFSPPAGQTCQVNTGSGTISGADVTNVSVSCSSGSGGTETLANDTWVDGGSASFQGGFVTGEIAASRFTPANTDPWSLDKVQFLFGGAATQQTVTLKVWDDSAENLNPGTEIYSADYLVTGGAFMQEIDLTSAGLNVSDSFRVGLLFQHDGAPSVARDDDGTINAARNFIKIGAGTWFDSQSLGLTGDWVLRAVVTQAVVPDPFVITSVVDFPNDQGRQVRVTWPNNANDAPGSLTPVTGYAIFRRIDSNLKAYPPGDWDFLTTVPAFQEASYGTIVPTAADSTIVDGMYWTTFFIRAMTASTGVFFDSAPDSGYSVDNLTPAVPSGFFVSYDPVAGNDLSWDESPNSDFAYFKIYRGNTPGFVIDPAAPHGTTTATDWVDLNGDFGDYYRVSAVDFSGNESDAGAPDGVSSAPSSDLPQKTSLVGAAPNPFNPATKLSFELAAAGTVSLKVYDTSGRLVTTLVNERREAGSHEVIWQGRDDKGRLAASGVYLYRLQFGGFTETKRMTLVK